MSIAEPNEGGRPRRSVPVAAVTDIGPREENQDRAFTSASDDGAWVIAVADGLGGHPRGAEAAQAAVDGLPRRIDSEAEMAVAFTEADERVLSLSGPRKRDRLAPLFTIPMTTLCVAAWTPENGLLIGWMGDTMPFVLRSGQDGFTGYCCGLPHRGPFGGIEQCLGMPPEEAGYGAGPVGVEVIADFEDSDLPDAVVIASDGAWEPLAADYGDIEWLWDPSPAGIGSACGPQSGDAAAIAGSVLATARGFGLNDNATVAVADRRTPSGR